LQGRPLKGYDRRVKKTFLYDEHLAQGGKMVDFSGWLLPVQYGGILKEHECVRTACGVFDTSHMGELRVTGIGAKAFVNRVISNNLEKIQAGQALYSPLLTEQGTFVDDLIVYEISDSEVFIVVNASNIDKDFSWILSKQKAFSFSGTVANESEAYSMLAVQGPKAPEVLDKIFPGEYAKLKAFSFSQLTYQGSGLFFSRTGYTGEEGVELIVKNEAAVALFQALLKAGAAPCGLGARDSLRLEKGYSLYGHEIDETTNAFEAGLGWTVDMGKKDFVGKAALEKIKAGKLSRKLVGLTMIDKGIPRNLYDIVKESGEKIGYVTSGTHAPSLGENIALAYIPADYAGEKILVDIRGKKLWAKIGKRKFI